jgi:hypothetical protein
MFVPSLDPDEMGDRSRRGYQADAWELPRGRSFLFIYMNIGRFCVFLLYWEGVQYAKHTLLANSTKLKRGFVPIYATAPEKE